MRSSFSGRGGKAEVFLTPNTPMSWSIARARSSSRSCAVSSSEMTSCPRRPDGNGDDDDDEDEGDNAKGDDVSSRNRTMVVNGRPLLESGTKGEISPEVPCASGFAGNASPFDVK